MGFEDSHFCQIGDVKIPVKAMSQFDLINYGRQLNIPNLKIVDLKFNDYNNKDNYIIFINKDGNIGHWVAFSKGYYFDSCGLIPTKNVFPHVKFYNNQRIQGISPQNVLCGHYCLYFLYNYNRNISPKKIVGALEKDQEV